LLIFKVCATLFAHDIFQNSQTSGEVFLNKRGFLPLPARKSRASKQKRHFFKKCRFSNPFFNMKFLVCISQTPDTTAKISFNADGSEFNAAGVQFIMNPYDEWYALVRACELREALGGTVVALNVGPAANETTIRKALAIGADEAVRINAEPKSAAFTAKQIAEYARSEQFDIIFFGKETIDYNGSEVGAMVAEHLDLPYVSYASKLDLNGSTATLERDIEGGVEALEVDMPFVVSAAKGMAEQRIPNMRGIMTARTKPLKEVQPVAFDDAAKAVKFTLPPAKAGVKLVDPANMEELVRLLHEEAKVI
jgi:electron transfer flavoprotein beta subunit